MATWNSSYEADPAGSASPSEGDDEIRGLKLEFRSRLDQEHVILNTASTGQSTHRSGSAVAYFQTTAPTLRPDGTTALGSSDSGRLWVDSDNGNLLKVYDNGSGTFEDITVGAISNTGNLSVSGTLTVAGETTLNDHLNIADGKELRLAGAAKITTLGETSPDCLPGGATFKQSSSSGVLVTFKNTGVNHVFPNLTEVDTYAHLGAYNQNSGGLGLTGFTETSTGLDMEGVALTTLTSTNGTSKGCCMIRGSVTDGGGGKQAMGANGNVLCVQSDSDTIAIFKGDGDLYLDSGVVGSFDRENDLELARALQLRMAGEDYKLEFDKRNEDLGIVQSGMMSIKGTLNLLLGTVWQLWGLVNGQRERIVMLEEKLVEDE